MNTYRSGDDPLDLDRWMRMRNHKHDYRWAQILIPFIILSIGGLISYGTLSSEMTHKASEKDVAVLTQQLAAIAKDVSENKDAIKETNDTVQSNHDILIKLEAFARPHDE